MDHLITWEKHKPSTMSGFAITVKHTFSSFDAAEINAIEQALKEAIGSGVVIENVTEGNKE